MLLLEQIARSARESSRALALIPDSVKRKALISSAHALLKNEKRILAANRKDVDLAQKKKLSPALIDRLTLSAKRIADMSRGVRQIAALADPIGNVVEQWSAAPGLVIKKVRVPLGVIAMIYESRPNVTVESAALCLKSGNAVILRGGSESVRSNSVLCNIFSKAATQAGVPKHSVSLIRDTDRRNIYELSRMDRWIDLVIARGSEPMVRRIQKEATVPVLGHGKGVCHVYVDKKADLKMAEEIAFNAKVQRPGVCNAMETLLVHRNVAPQFLPAMSDRYFSAGVELRGDPASRKIFPKIKPASEKDWSTEYLDLVLAVKVVDSLESAMEHINRYGSGHTDTIVTEDPKAAAQFLKGVDASAVFHNISTRMHDGGVFGLGAEIGISTQKMHARGTMGIRDLTTTKYIGTGQGQIRQ